MKENNHLQDFTDTRLVFRSPGNNLKQEGNDEWGHGSIGMIVDLKFLIGSALNGSPLWC